MTTPAAVLYLFLKILFMRLFLAMRFLPTVCTPSLVVASGRYSVLWLLIVVTSLPAGHGPRGCGHSGCGPRAQLLCGTRDLRKTGDEPVCPASAGDS